MPSDLQSESAIDPARPWIDDPEQDPKRQNWFATFFNPMGTSPKLHFTRAWTALFMMQFLSVFAIGLILFVVSLAGADTAGLSVAAGYFTACVFLVTSILSVIVHCRRLNHAGRLSVLAVVVLLPLAISSVVTVRDVAASAVEYDALYQQRAEFLDNPRAFRDAALQRQRVENAQRNREGNADDRARGGGPDRRASDSYNPENPLPSQEAFILRPHVQQFWAIILGLSALLVPWSLMWVGRLQPR